jgi:hypothetical protein
MNKGEWEKVVPFDRCARYGCSKPIPRMNDYGIGSIWKCECGTRWVIADWKSDQRDGAYPVWQKVR